MDQWGGGYHIYVCMYIYVCVYNRIGTQDRRTQLRMEVVNSEEGNLGFCQGPLAGSC